ncbi:protein of unknown function [Paraburkholderia kururiensis]
MPDKELLSEHGFGNASLLYVRRPGCVGGARQKTWGQENARPEESGGRHDSTCGCAASDGKGSLSPRAKRQSNEGDSGVSHLPFSPAVSGAEHRPTLNAHGAFQELA